MRRRIGGPVSSAPADARATRGTDEDEAPSAATDAAPAATTDEATDEATGSGPGRPSGSDGTGPTDTTSATSAQFRAALGRWASGVTVVAVRDEGRVFGITVSAFASVSADPPLVLVCLGANAVVLPMLEHDAPLVINLLAADQRRTATVFADVGPLGQELFPPAGPPILPGSLASLVCTVHALHPGGDHTIVVARVQDIVIGAGTSPLLRYERAWRRLESD